jgi:NADPH-dependent curcumin reductase CurA
MNRKIVLASRPENNLKSSDFRLETDLLSTTLKSGEVLVRVEYVSIDPHQRGNL